MPLRKLTITFLSISLICGSLICTCIADKLMNAQNKHTINQAPAGSNWTKGCEEYKLRMKAKEAMLTNTLETNKAKEGYLVWNPRCKILETDPCDESILPFIKEYEAINCTDKPLLTSVVRSGDHHTLVLHAQNLKYYLEGNKTVFDDGINCCYSIIRRSGSNDDDLIVGECLHFHKNVSFSDDEEFVYVKCYTEGEESEELYQNMHAFVGKSETARMKIRNENLKKDKLLSVIIIGIDCMSRPNIIRSMPNTYRALSKDWVEYKGYNKIGEKTFPNVMAFVTGLNVSSIEKTCMRDAEDPLDDCGFIWNDASNKSYVTLYAEDFVKCATFNWYKFGFLQAPTDHYMRPSTIYANQKLNIHPPYPNEICSGPEFDIDRLMNYLFDFSIEYQGHPQFALVWSNSFSHDDVNGPTFVDNKFVSYLSQLEKLGLYNSSFIILLSDHGSRYGLLRQTYLGWLEDRLPFIFFHVPEWWKKENPEKYNNLKSNHDKLTTAFDLYLTLKEVIGGQSENGTSSCPDCRSLFTPIPWNRSCTDAGIPFEWCSCERHVETNKTSEIVQKGAAHLVQVLNNVISNIPAHSIDDGYTCASLSLKEVIKAHKAVQGEDLNVTFDIYTITVQTTPGDAILESTIKFTQTTNAYEIIGDIRRLNMYGNQSACILFKAILRLYCFCTVNLKQMLLDSDGSFG